VPVRIDKPWIVLDESNLKSIASHLGVYQLANVSNQIVYIGVADATTRFGLKGELENFLKKPRFGATRFRLEINMAYRTRYLELLQVFYFDYKRLPIGNDGLDAGSLGTLRPGGEEKTVNAS
jgi:hypothetical protein